jgi:predicted LPLAT superfamily acyltransferase
MTDPESTTNKSASKPTHAKAATATWITDKERSSMWMLRMMRWFAMNAGRRLSRLTLYPITLYFLAVNRKARQASALYLSRALKRPPSWLDVYRHIYTFAATVLDRVYFLQEQFHQFDVHHVGAPIIHSAMDRGEGVVLMGAHMGSFESLRAIAALHGGRVAMLMYEDNARLINATLAAIAPKAKLHTITLGQTGAMLALRNWLDGGGMAGLLADRTLPTQSARSHTLWLDFLGQPAPFSDGPFRLAAMLRKQVIFMTGLYFGGNRYELRFVELVDFRPSANDEGLNKDTRIRNALQSYVNLLESLCIETPYNWFNFFDFWAGDAAVKN